MFVAALNQGFRSVQGIREHDSVLKQEQQYTTELINKQFNPQVIVTYFSKSTVNYFLYNLYNH